MMKLTIVLSLAVGALLAQPSARAATGCEAMSPGKHQITVVSGGRQQRIELEWPKSLDTTQGAALVIGLHPSGGSGESFARSTGLAKAATDVGFAAVFPDGAVQLEAGGGHYWNVPGVPLVGGEAVPDGTRDDVRFIADIIDHVVKHNCVDAHRIYVTGFSGGARMSSALACRLSDRIAAVAPVAGLRAGRATAPSFDEPDASDCRPSRAVSVLAVHGTDDSTNPFGGGQGSRWGYSVERAVERWATLDRCSKTPAREKVSDHVTRVRYGDCTGESEVVLYQVAEGGHVWPGDATQLVLEFFRTRG